MNDRPPADWRVTWLPAASVALLATAVFAGSLGNNFTFDDVFIVSQNPLVRDSGLGALLTSNYWAGAGAEGSLYRPLTLATYWLNHRVAPSAWAYHLVNMIFHGVITALVYFVCRRLATTPVAVAAAVLFATHPVHSEAVVSIVGRAELLGMMFALAAWLSRDRVVLSALLFGLGLLSKENAVVLPGLLLVEDLMTLGIPRQVRDLWSLVRRYIPFVLVLVAYLALRMAVLGWMVGGNEDPFADGPVFDRILTGIYILGRYLGLMVWPATLSADYSYNQIPIVTSVFDPRFLGGALAVAACLAVAVWAGRSRRDLATIPAGIAIFFIAILPLSNLFFGFGGIMAERFLYLPSLGLCLAVGGALSMANRKGHGFLVPILLGLMAAGLTLRSVVRTWDWADDLTLFEATVKTSSNSYIAHTNLGKSYQALGRMEEAEAAYRRALDISPDRMGTHFNLATLLESMGRRDEAIRAYRAALNVDPDSIRVLNNLGIALIRDQRPDEAIEILERALEIDPEAPRPAVNLAAACFATGDLDRAEALARSVLERYPRHPNALSIMRSVMEKRGGAQ